MKNKKGKKLVVLGAMAALLTLIGVSGSQTYAKYVEGKVIPSKTATVAKWGYIAEADATYLFADKHDSVKDANVSTKFDSGYLTMQGEDLILAPGAAGSVVFGVYGTAQVATSVSIDITSTKQVYLDSYRPVKWTLEICDDPTALSRDWNPVVGFESFDDLEDDDFQNVFSTVSHQYGPDAEMDDEINCLYRLSYEWAFEITGTEDEKKAANEKDTVLGEYANGVALPAAYTSANVTLDLAITISVEQVNA